VLFTLLATTGLRVEEALGLHVENLQLQRDDDRLSVLGKGGRHRTVLLEDPTVLRFSADTSGRRTMPTVRCFAPNVAWPFATLLDCRG